MNFTGNHTDPFALDTLAVGATSSKPSVIARLMSRSTTAIVQNAMLEATVDRCQAQLAKTALEHTGALSAMEAQLSAATPQATGRYRVLVDAYAFKAVQRILGGDGCGG